jgi:hypothetical protein
MPAYTTETPLPLTSESTDDEKTKAENKKNFENSIILGVLGTLTITYLYLLLSPSQRHVSRKPRNFIIKHETEAQWQEFLQEFRSVQTGRWSYGSGSSSSYNYTVRDEWGSEGRPDDFFLDGYYGKDHKSESEYDKPIVPSAKYHCETAWVTIRSEVNYKYLWMHAEEQLWMGATATMDTPLERKAMEMIPLSPNCAENGWVRLREGDTDAFIYMSIPVENQTVDDEWVVKLGTSKEEETRDDYRYHFLFEEEGYILNRAKPAFLNVMSNNEYTVRGHSSGWDRSKPAGREYGTSMHFQIINATEVEESRAEELREEKEAKEQDEMYIQQIANFPKSDEKRVISFGLYGAKPKYIQGAIRNAELTKVYFPGWICRFYITSDVPEDVVNKLKELGSEIEAIPSGMGYTSGMFWRFLVASDETVDRYIIRDVDSRLNARDRMAVEEWINSKYPVHIMRDHVNHCLVMNGGMWGGVKNAVSFMKDRVMEWKKRDEYMADLYFLEEAIWPDIKNKQISHDSYCCDRFPNTKPFPTKRYTTYQHVGQVFDAHDNPRYLDIDGYIRGVPIPGSCRKQTDWIYG